MSAEPEADRGRPTLSGDLPTVLEAAPMFRRALVGYDRFQVDTYVRWAEDELATAEREREHLAARQLRTDAALEEARELLSHSPAGGDFLRLSRRMGTMLAAAADQAEAIRADAEAMRAEARAGRTAAAAQAVRVLADAEARSAEIVAAALTEAETVRAAAARTVDEAEQAREEARKAVAAQRRRARAIERRAVEQAEQIRQQAADDAAAARLQARAEIVQMLTTGRDERRRADAAAAATRERLDRDAAARRAALLDDIEQL